MRRRPRQVSSRGLSVKYMALALTFASVFLVGFTSPVHASSIADKNIALFTEPTTASPLQETSMKIDELNIDLRTKAELIEDKKAEVEKKEQEAAELAIAKQAVQSEVGDLKQQVSQLQARLAEKRRLEALRIVPPSRNASDSYGNSYTPGNCTYYVKTKRPDLSNSLGNANTWYSYAKAMGYKTGTMAKTGAVGTTTAGYLGHVVYVEKWLGNGLILISEMNWGGLWRTNTRIANEADFVYIYELP